MKAPKRNLNASKKRGNATIDNVNKKSESSTKKRAAYSHSFSPDFYGDVYAAHKSSKPTTVADAIASMDNDEWDEMAQEIFGVSGDIYDVMRKIIETDTVGTLTSPVDVWIDPEGWYTVNVWDAQEEKREGSLRVEAPGRPPKAWWDKMEKEISSKNPDYSDEQIKKTVGNIWYNELSQYRRNELTKKHESSLRISGERIAAINTRVEAAQFPNLFSSDTRKWIKLQTRNLAANMGPISSPSQAIAFVNDAANQVTKELTNAVPEEVTKIIEAEKEDILNDIVTETTQFEEELPEAPQMPLEQPAPVAASKKALMPHRLKVAFEKSANPAEQSLAMVRGDPNFLVHLNELSEQAESIEELAEWLKEYVIGRGLIDTEVADKSDWVSPTKMLTSSRKLAGIEDTNGTWETEEAEKWILNNENMYNLATEIVAMNENLSTRELGEELQASLEEYLSDIMGGDLSDVDWESVAGTLLAG
jgi:hypothetical protein